MPRTDFKMWFDTKLGVTQESVLSSILFNVIMNEIVGHQIVTRTKARKRIQMPNSPSTQYGTE
jgi:hypothetical protein